MPLKRFIFIRHGDTNWNIKLLKSGPKDYGLNNLGKQQALNAAENIKKYVQAFPEIQFKILSSTLSRAKETAEIIGKYNSLSILFDDKLNERYYGDHSKNEITDQESLENFHKRVNLIIKDILSSNQEQLIIVSHQGVFKAIQEILVKPTILRKLDNGEIATFWHNNVNWCIDTLDEFSTKCLGEQIFS
jgi:probable phosphoglycerate mutase